MDGRRQIEKCEEWAQFGFVGDVTLNYKTLETGVRGAADRRTSSSEALQNG